MTLDAHVTGIWCGQIGGGVGIVTITIRDQRVAPCWIPYKHSICRKEGLIDSLYVIVCSSHSGTFNLGCKTFS